MRDLVATVFLGCCLLKGTVDHLTDTRALDWFRETSERMQKLGATATSLRAIGASGDEIGYVAADDPARSAEFYYGLQYQMLPSILIPSADLPLVVVHTQDHAYLVAFEQTQHLELVGDAGNYFYLLKHEAR